MLEAEKFRYHNSNLGSLLNKSVLDSLKLVVYTLFNHNHVNANVPYVF